MPYRVSLVINCTYLVTQFPSIFDVESNDRPVALQVQNIKERPSRSRRQLTLPNHFQLLRIQPKNHMPSLVRLLTQLARRRLGVIHPRPRQKVAPFTTVVFRVVLDDFFAWLDVTEGDVGVD